MAEECIFCRIASGEIPAAKLAENNHAIAFRDINPMAAFHALIIPRAHITGFRDIHELSPESLQGMIELIGIVAAEQGLLTDGFRVVTNDGSLAGQTVFHLHWHLLSGQKLGSFA